MSNEMLSPGVTAVSPRTDCLDWGSLTRFHHKDLCVGVLCVTVFFSNKAN